MLLGNVSSVVSKGDCSNIITKLEDGWSIRAVTRGFRLIKHTVFKIKKRWEQEGTLRRKAGSGHAKISNNVEDLRLITYLEENPFKTSRDSIVNTHFPGSPVTACRRIKNSDTGNYAVAKNIILSQESKQSRVLFALNHSARDMGFWQRVVFTDEKVFQNTNDGHIRVYRPCGTRFEEKFVTGAQRSECLGLV
jgi:hypothetical protein